MLHIRAAFSLGFLAFVSFAALASRSGPPWAYAVVALLWVVAAASLWRASAVVRHGADRRLAKALEQGGDETREVAGQQAPLRRSALLWAVASAGTAGAALALAFIVTS